MIGRVLVAGIAAALLLSGCGGNGPGETSRACPTPAAELTPPPHLPPEFPVPDQVTLTGAEMAGPTTIVEGYWDGDLTEAFEVFKEAFPAAGYNVTKDEKEAADAEVFFDGGGTNGQVKLETECAGRTRVKFTIRPA